MVGRNDFERLAALLRAGLYAELEAATRELLARAPESGLHWQLLAAALRHQGKDALAELTAAVRYSPDDPVAHLNLGNALGRLGRLEGAMECYANALAIRADFAEAHNNLSDVQLELGRFAEAAQSGRRALEINPHYAEAHQNLGKALARLGHFVESAASCRHALEIKPDFAEAHNSLGNALLQLARSDDAVACFRRALAIDPDFAEAHVNLANALRSVGRLDEAVAGYRRALEISPYFVAAHTELGTALRLQQRTDECEVSCQRALALEPNSTAPLAVLAELRADSGRFIEAEQLFKRVVAMEPGSVEGWAGLARLRRMTPVDGAWLAAVQRLAQQRLPPPRELLLRYAMGKYFDDLRDFEHAFHHYRRANQLAKQCGPVHDRTQLTRSVDLIVRSHDAGWIGSERHPANGSRRPVFIVGMPRSGTTLAEQILASHPAVFGAGELSYWGARSAALITGATAASATVAGTLALNVSDATLAGLASGYLSLLQRLSPDAERVVDKFPANFLFLGFMHAALPRARIIHLQRNPIDTCLSIYFQHFEAANTYANDLEDLAHYYREYRRLMHHWRGVLPAGAILDVPYEGLVADLPRWSREMLTFIDLPWDARCLEFHRTARTVVTASRWQVRQRIDNSSVGRWRHYEKFLGPLQALLDEAALSPP
jgi:tetratricopeptide (TPR) repeat protein